MISIAILTTDRRLGKADVKETQLKQELEALEAKLVKKDQVIAEISENDDRSPTF